MGRKKTCCTKNHVPIKTKIANSYETDFLTLKGFVVSKLSDLKNLIKKKVFKI